MRRVAGQTAWRLVGMLVTMLVVSFVVFAMLYIAPGDPVAFVLGDQPTDPATIASIRAEYHLDDPFLLRYWVWLSGILQGDFGTSILFRVPVSGLLGERAVNSLFLATYASLLILIPGILLGIVSGLRGGWRDRMIMVVTAAGQAIPAYVAAIFLIATFAVGLGWFPVSGAGSGFVDRLWHMTLPAFAMALVSLSVVTRVTRTSIREESRSEHVETARSRGIPESLVRRRHIVRNGLIPIVTVSGLVVATQISGAVVVETAFGIEGLGSYLVKSVQQRDFAVVQAITLILVAVFVVANTVVDVLYGVLDPRVRARSARS
ncbi:ABC transporter permease [Capillimicrobium parvum]|uniref:ABC transporter permease n=1 Tax=Capillimicrobium parvum TaxID=2884022 RepID=UPI00216B20C7|nr:ABC transporter permease [Capillimicrobium parvum]